jgi:hypothetical protein
MMSWSMPDEAWLENPDAAAFTGQVLPFELARQAQILAEQMGGFRRGFRQVRFTASSSDDPLYPCTTTFGNGCNMAFRREVLLALGGFDEALDTGPSLPGGGDLDMLYRVVRAGHPLIYEPRFLVFHQHRRDYNELRRQISRSWGTGCMAFLVKICRTDPEQRWKAEKFIGWWLQDLARRLPKSWNRPPPFSLDFVCAEFWGALIGLSGAYQRSQARASRIREQFAAE